MNYPIIKDLFERGCISESMPVSKAQKETAKKLFEFEERIKQYLPDGGEEIIREYSLLQGELNAETESTSFAEGFKTGLLVGFEAFYDLLKK